MWNPDELFWRVNMALGGEMKFDETEPDYNYPSLPKHIMYGVGWLVDKAGGSQVDILVVARLISVLSTLATAVFLGLTVHTFTRDRLASVATGVFFLAVPYVVYWSGLARIDSLALAFAAAGLYVLARWPSAWWIPGLALTKKI